LYSFTPFTGGIYDRLDPGCYRNITVNRGDGNFFKQEGGGILGNGHGNITRPNRSHSKCISQHYILYSCVNSCLFVRVCVIVIEVHYQRTARTFPGGIRQGGIKEKSPSKIQKTEHQQEHQRQYQGEFNQGLSDRIPIVFHWTTIVTVLESESGFLMSAIAFRKAPNIKVTGFVTVTLPEEPVVAQVEGKVISLATTATPELAPASTTTAFNPVEQLLKVQLVLHTWDVA
jgi:hypothetical protein